MDEQELLAARFEEHRPRLRAVAYRMLGSAAESDDAVHDTWLRLTRTDVGDVANLGGWLTTVVARVSSTCCAAARPAVRIPGRHVCRGLPWATTTASGPRSRRSSPTRSAWRCSWCWTRSRPQNVWRSCCTTCSPCRSTRSPSSWSSLRPRPGSSPVVHADACRARSRIPAPTWSVGAKSSTRSWPLRTAATSRRCWPCSTRTSYSASTPRRLCRARPGRWGPLRSAGTFAEHASAAQPALIDGLPGAVRAPDGRPRVVIGFTIEAGRIVSIDLVADADRLGRMDLQIRDA